MNSLSPPRSSAATLGEAYTTDLMPLWRYILWKLNPLRLVRRKPALRWTTIRPHLSGTYMVLVMPDADYPEKAMAVCHVDADFIDTDHINARIWGQTKPISEYPVNYLWYGPVPLPTSR